MKTFAQQLAELIEEAIRRRPPNAGADWILQWLAMQSNLPMTLVRGIEYELKRDSRQDPWP